MQHGLHFISGLPRAGSTLLSALLRQNPRFHAAMSSPVFGLVNTLRRQMSQVNEGSIFIDDDQRVRILNACVDAYYAEIGETKLVFDTNRGWTTSLSLIERLWPDARMICCVRDPAWVLDSLEGLVRRNALEPSSIFDYEPGATVYARAEALKGATGLIGYAVSALREAAFHASRGKLLLVRYESLTANPAATLAAIYDFIGEPAFQHDPRNIEQDFDALMFDARIGAVGLHTVGSVVRHVERPSILPADLFERFHADAFWLQPGGMPADVRMI